MQVNEFDLNCYWCIYKNACMRVCM